MKTKTTPPAEFGEFIRQHRLSKSITGRAAASAAEMLPSNFSKLEHGVLTPPREAAKLKKLAAAIGLDSEDASACAQFFDLAARATDSVPVDIADLISADEAMPLLLRTIGNKRLTAQEIARLIEIVRSK